MATLKSGTITAELKWNGTPTADEVEAVMRAMDPHVRAAIEAGARAGRATVAMVVGPVEETP